MHHLHQVIECLLFLEQFLVHVSFLVQLLSQHGFPIVQLHLLKCSRNELGVTSVTGGKSLRIYFWSSGNRLQALEACYEVCLFLIHAVTQMFQKPLEKLFLEQIS